jgi:hypothetical protein
MVAVLFISRGNSYVTIWVPHGHEVKDNTTQGEVLVSDQTDGSYQLNPAGNFSWELIWQEALQIEKYAVLNQGFDETSTKKKRNACAQMLVPRQSLADRADQAPEPVTDQCKHADTMQNINTLTARSLHHNHLITCEPSSFPLVLPFVPQINKGDVVQ